MSKKKSPVTMTMTLPEELAKSIRAMAELKELSAEVLMRLWLEEGLEKEELRFERLLLFADLAEDLTAEAVELLARLKQKHFDERSDGQRGLDSFMVRSPNLNSQYIATSGKIPGSVAK